MTTYIKIAIITGLTIGATAYYLPNVYATPFIVLILALSVMYTYNTATEEQDNP